MNYKEEFINDVRKNPRKDWLRVGAVWMLIIYALFSGMEVRASEQITFGSHLRSVQQEHGPWQIYDVDRLVRAIGMHETRGCTIGSGKSHNNAGGVMTWHRGFREFKYYESCEDSYKDMARIWSTYYGRMPDLRLAKKYSGNDRPTAWLNNVTNFYNERN